jgi:hypothetical protein
MAFRLSDSPANRAYEVFKSLFESEEDLAAWMWKFKDCIVPDSDFDDGSDSGTRQYIDVIEIRHPKTGQVTSLDDMPSMVTVYGIGTNRERAFIEWLGYPDDTCAESSQLRPPVERSYDVTLEEYCKWAVANGIQTKMPIMKNSPQRRGRAPMRSP